LHYGLLVTWHGQARMFVVTPGWTAGRLAEFCRDRFQLGDGRLALAVWGGQVLAPGEGVPPEGTPLVLRRI
jgi:hypothetical protein